MIWKHLNQQDAKALTAWTNDKLDREPRVVGSYIFWPWTSASERKSIMHGEQPAAVKRGRPRNDNVWEARRDVDLIRQIWKQHKKFLDDKFKRRTGRVEVTAEQIAADRHDVDPEAVRSRLHKKA